MEIVDTYSFKNGKAFIDEKHPEELKDIEDAIRSVNIVDCFCKESRETTKKLKLLCSPTHMNRHLKLLLHQKGWTKKAKGKKKVYSEPRYAFEKNRFREMDGMKNMVGLEIQFGKYAFMGYDIFSKMVMFNKIGLIECGIEVVPGRELVKEMSTGVSSFDQLKIDFKYRGESDIDIPVYIISIGMTPEEKVRTIELQSLFKTNRREALKQIELHQNNGSLPGPK